MKYGLGGLGVGLMGKWTGNEDSRTFQGIGYGLRRACKLLARIHGYQFLRGILRVLMYSNVLKIYSL